jgi:hypothetical protein
MAYRPAWLAWGGAVAALSLLVMITAALAALVSRPGREQRPRS